MAEILTIIAVVALHITAVPATVFPVWYGIVSPWERSYEGRSSMLMAISVMLLVDLSVANVYLPTSDLVAAAANLGVLLLLLAAVTVQLVSFVRQRRKVNRHEDRGSSG